MDEKERIQMTETNYTEYDLDEYSVSDFISRSVKVFPVYVYTELNNIVATNELPTDKHKLLANLCTNRHELLVAVQALVDQLEY